MSTAASASPEAATLTALTFSNGKAFFADDAGGVWMAPLQGTGPATPLARRQLGVTSIVAGPANVYWATAGCSVMTVPVPPQQP